MPRLDPIKNIVVVMMENRSFDHLLGCLSLPEKGRADVDGLRTDAAWLNEHANLDQERTFVPFPSLNPYTMPGAFDPPHERANVAANLGPLQSGVYPMKGFVSGIPATVAADPEVRRLVMSYFAAAQAPVNEFFASNFAICDRWFSALPAGTQPNRLMSMSGFSKIEVNQTPLPDQELVYDWLNAHQITWRVYHQGIPFFALMPKWIPQVLGDDHFRSFGRLEEDVLNNPPAALPRVIFVEPTYGDSPHLGRSTDDHAPAGISDGQEFLLQVYNAVTAGPDFWRQCVLIVDYDEHGGFYDHVSPPLITTAPPPGAAYAPFDSLGVRTPGYVISPFVRRGSVSHALFDHTSVLKFIGEKFGPGGSYSDLLDQRPVGSVSAALDFDQPINDPPAVPPLDGYLAQRPPAPAGATAPTPSTPLQQAFADALRHLQENGAGPDHPKFGPLIAALAAPPVPAQLNPISP